jgi:hypothetical protein
VTEIATRICPGAKIYEKLAPRRLTVAKEKAFDFCVDIGIVLPPRPTPAHDND